MDKSRFRRSAEFAFASLANEISPLERTAPCTTFSNPDESVHEIVPRVPEAGGV